MTEKRFENRLDKSNVKFNTLNPTWDNEKETGLNVFEMIDELNNLSEEKEKLQFELKECYDRKLFSRREFSKEHRQHISESMKGEKHRNYGKPLPKETREKIRQANTGHKHSEETKQKISNSHIGKTHSNETKLKMSNNQNTTGYFRVSICRNKCYKKGYGYQYQWYDENGKRKRITAVTIEALKDKVLKKGLEWKLLMEAIE